MPEEILIITEDKKLSESIKSMLSDMGCTISLFSFDEGKHLETENSTLLIVDLRETDKHPRIFSSIFKKSATKPVIAIIDPVHENAGIDISKNGIYDFVCYPVEADVLRKVILRTVEHGRLLKENEALYEYIELYSACRRIITQVEEERLRASALETFVIEARARAGIYGLIHGQKSIPRLIDILGLEEETARDILVSLRGELEVASFDRRPLKRISISKEAKKYAKITARGYDRIELLLLKDSADDYGVLIALGHSSDILPGPRFEDNAGFLARNIIIGWHNVKLYTSTRKLAYVDPLTGAYNSSFIELELERMMSRKENRPLVLLFMDLDHFKEVNDNYGHLNGSEVLIETFHLIQSQVRENDIIARFGGDEFIVILKNTKLMPGVKVAERIRRAIRNARFKGKTDLNISVTICIGVASYPEHTQDPLDLIGLADKAMYVGKTSGRDQTNIAEIGKKQKSQ